MRTYLILVILLLCVGCDAANAGKSIDNANVVVDFKSVKLAIPSKYFVNHIPNLPAASSMDRTHEVLLKLPMADLGFAMDDSRGLVGNITMLISKASKHYSSNKLSPDAINAWMGVGLYDERIVERDEVAILYRVASEAGHPKLWHYFKQKPVKHDSQYGEWVANCMVGPLEEERKDLSNVACNTVIIDQSLQIEITFSGLHINSFKAIDTAIRNKLKNWKTI